MEGAGGTLGLLLGGVLLMLLNAAALFAMFYFLTQYLQEVLGYRALKAGMAFLPLSIGILAAPAWPRRPSPALARGR